MRPHNWVFLGDSLTEGLGSRRATYVSELARLLHAERPERAIHDMRLRGVDPETFNPYIRTNLAGHLESSGTDGPDAMWFWNLAAERQTIETDVRWLPLLRNLSPERIFIYRGSLESIIRPAGVRDGGWPWWVPGSWRGFVSMDPRIYFSSTWYRYIKQAGLDALKQKARLRLLAERPGRPLLDAETVLGHYSNLLKALSELHARVHVLGVIPTDDTVFPGTGAYLGRLNEQLRALAASAGVSFIDWGRHFAEHPVTDWRFRDGFHPNPKGAQLLGRILRDELRGEVP